MQETVRQLMKEQHKAMFIALRDGQFDHIFEDASSGGSHAPHAASSPPASPAASAPPAASVSSSPAAPTPAPVVAAPPPPVPAPVAVTPPAPAVQIAASPAPAGHAATPQPPSSAPIPPVPPSVPKLNLPRGPIPSVTMPRVDASAASSMLGPSASDPHLRPKVDGVDLDLAALEKSAAVAASPFVQQTQDLPPAPASLKKPGTLFTAGVYRALGANEPASSPPQSAGRYAPSRPPAIFASAKPTQGASIFGEDLISEKSLDEVILSYLAEDLEGSDGA